jgi:hypothetical protein
MSSFPILLYESFTFNYDDKRGVDLEFRPRKKKNKKEEEQERRRTRKKKNKNEKPIE